MKIRKMAQGFTLVELMVVVAIIGILSAVAVPNFKQYQAKARTSEAKLALAGMYTGMISKQADDGSFLNNAGGTFTAPTLNAIGTEPPTAGNYYAGGLGGSNYAANKGAAVAPAGAIVAHGCNAQTTQDICNPVMTACQATIAPSQTTTPAGVASDSFVASAIGSIVTASLWDKWSIDQKKTLAQCSKGW